MTVNLSRKRPQCHSTADMEIDARRSVVLVGSPNVGKSVVFGNLTGMYVTVSNYPGTTVEITRGRLADDSRAVAITDTPGMYSLLSITEEERVARRVLMENRPDMVVHVADTKNIERMLHLTVQLLEAGMPLVLDLNLMDEAERLGMRVDTKVLKERLGIPVVATVATKGMGMDELKKMILKEDILPSGPPLRYPETIENAIADIAKNLDSSYGISKRAVALLLLQDDHEIWQMVRDREPERYALVDAIVKHARERFADPLNYIITIERQRFINTLIEDAMDNDQVKGIPFRERLSRLSMHPVAGVPIFLGIIYLLYEFVGVFGAQTAVDFLEETVFGQYINPVANRIVSSIIPWKVLQDLFVNEYGIITLGIRYAIAIILPIVTTFFIAFSIIEDTGYLPRLAMLIDRVFKKIGLNGRAVIPVVLGFGCDTMATMVTRTLETRRERVIATLLLALAIPCSAQMGVILALLSGSTKALGIFVMVMGTVFLFVGFLAARLMPGERPLFYMEVPPLRWPKLSNVLTKTYTRVEWYFKEVLPLFILASILIWAGRITGLFDLVIKVLSYPTGWIGLPPEASKAFLYGFFRRDFGAAGLYDLKTSGALSGVPLVVSIITIALFMPCIAQFSMTIKERGWKMAVGMAAFIFPFAFVVGYLVNLILNGLGVVL